MTKLLVEGLAALIVLLVVVVIATANGRSKPRPALSTNNPSANTPASATTLPAVAVTTVSASQTAASQVAGLLQQSKIARQVVVDATRRVGSCQESPSQGIQELQQAINTRNTVLTALNGVQLSAISGGPQSGQVLQQALQASVNADNSFIGWMNDIASSGCPVATNSDASYQAAISASQQATGAKSSFVAWWNPVAGQYGLPTFVAADL